MVLMAVTAAAPAQVSKAPGPGNNPFYEQLKGPWQLFYSGKLQDAAAGFRAVLQAAVAAADGQAQAWCHFGLGTVLEKSAQYPAAIDEFAQALKLYESVHDESGVAYASAGLGAAAQYMGNAPAARDYYRTALGICRRLGLLSLQARVLGALAWLSDGAEAEHLVDEELSIARQTGDKQVEAKVLQDIGDTQFTAGKFDAAEERYDQAAALYEQIRDKDGVARVRISQGRLQRAHGHPEKALDFYRNALKLQQEMGDREGQIETMSAMALAYSLLPQRTQSLELYERAMSLAKETGSERLIVFASGNLAGAYLDAGRNREAAEILEKIADRDRDHPDYRYGALAGAYFNLGRFPQAREAAIKAVDLARAGGNMEHLPDLLLQKARIESKLGEQEAALADANECLRVVEQTRRHLAPSDFMKRGFAETTRDAFDVTIRLLAEAHQPARALEAAEQARARAFLDLLATRDLQGARGQAVMALREVEGTLIRQGLDPFGPGPDAAGSALWKQWTSADPELRSLVAVPSIAISEIQAAALRLNSTILSYWVSREATYIWVVPPVGEIHFARADIAESKLKQKIQSLWPGRTGAGGGGKPPVRSGAAVTLRGGDTLASNTASPQTWRELYRLLVHPVEKWLPARRGALLTVEAHGCLLVLPLAALQNEQGQYLVERFTLHSIPAISLLQFTERKKSSGPHDTSRYLLVADPTGTPPGPNGKLLPALPGARQEISSVARLLPASLVTALVGKDASEQRVAELAGGSEVIHLATHGVIREDDPMESYLALSRSGPGPGQDGLLTAQKVYGLELHSDLVFLSACRSGLGQLSGDGINGLTRAFMYAGTPSVIASLWDVADETTNRLVTGFYRAWLGGADKARGLRSAQLALLGALRAGRVSVQTPYGKVVLPEDPVFWASFVLQGEP